jgi:2-polyprenyl-6-hydroxyphenyl methylase/3-demethylubiquinone-9 3-methyltransferase
MSSISRDPAAAKRAFEAMMTMQKIDIAKIEAASAVERRDVATFSGAGEDYA